ncbi:MAG: hypothetical protein LBJ13_01225, partial [Puniceicoccales bacterium]|jgi:hypothetical protein|nr:hypothetical protein [Puniceicoccales bacterium]
VKGLDVKIQLQRCSCCPNGEVIEKSSIGAGFSGSLVVEGGAQPDGSFNVVGIYSGPILTPGLKDTIVQTIRSIKDV